MSVAIMGRRLAMASEAGEASWQRRARDKPVRLFYRWDEFKRILANWPRWSAMLYTERQRFEEGGRIDRREVRSNAGWTAAVLAYFDLELYTLRVRHRLGERAEDVFRDYWQRQLTNDQIAERRRMSNSTVTALLWTFTEDVAELMVRRGGDDEMTPSERVREWKEERRGKSRDFV